MARLMEWGGRGVRGPAPKRRTSCSRPPQEPLAGEGTPQGAEQLLHRSPPDAPSLFSPHRTELPSK